MKRNTRSTRASQEAQAGVPRVAHESLPFQPDRPFAPPSRHRSAFTLIELLAVILVIAILLGLMTHAARQVIRIARDRRLIMTCRTLESALARYRDEYGYWPIPRDAQDNYDTAFGGPFVFSVSGITNRYWFHLLRATSGNADNPKRIRFLDESTLFTVTNQIRTRLCDARAASPDTQYPIVSVNRSGRTVYFNVTINVDMDTVAVGF